MIALDGVHPTTVGYGLVAQEVVRIMRSAGVSDAVDVDFEKLVGRDTLVSDPPATLTADFHIVGWLNEQFDILKSLMRHLSSR